MQIRHLDEYILLVKILFKKVIPNKWKNVNVGGYVNTTMTARRENFQGYNYFFLSTFCSNNQRQILSNQKQNFYSILLYTVKLSKKKKIAGILNLFNKRILWRLRKYRRIFQLDNWFYNTYSKCFWTLLRRAFFTEFLIICHRYFKTEIYA